jgi:sodium--glutamate symport carrier gltS
VRAEITQRVGCFFSALTLRDLCASAVSAFQIYAPVVGAFFIDFSNAIIIVAFANLIK